MAFETDIPDSQRALFLMAKETLELQTTAVPQPQAGEVLLKIGSVGVCGSDKHFYFDGRCGSGKSTLAGLAAHRLGCPLFHMDDFFLPPALRTPERYAAPGGNVHYERVEAELLRPLRETGAACFRPFDCRSMDFSAPIRAELTGLALVEGSYALHPALRGWYDRTVFLTCSPGEQRLRLLAREGPKRLPAFLERWIPLEEAYFQSTGLPGGCDLVLDTTP